MKTVFFAARPNGYVCSEPNDQSGRYVRIEDVAELTEAATELMSQLIDAVSTLRMYYDCDSPFESYEAAIRKAKEAGIGL